MNLANFLIRTASVFPENVAVSRGRADLYTYRELARRVSILSGRLRSNLGLQHGDRVALLMKNRPEFLEILYALWHAGLTAVPINSKLHPKEVEYILSDAMVALLFTTRDEGGDHNGSDIDWPARVVAVDSPEYTSLFCGDETPPGPYADGDLAWLFYTSGTTGRPKGAMLTHENLLAMTLCYFSDVDGVSARDCALYAAPMSHGAGLYNFPHVAMGARHVLPESGAFDPAEVLELAGYFRNASMFAAPTMVRRLVDYVAQDADPSGIKTIVYGGGPMYLEDILRGLDVMGNRFVQIYGQGESPMTITSLSRFHIGDSEHPRYLKRLASVGVAQSAVEVKVVDALGHQLPAEVGGEIVVRGSTVMRGYWNNPVATAQTIRQGWLHTGDIGVFDEDGFLTVLDRSKDVIISGGSNIYPREIEEVLLLHPSIAEVSVVGRPNPEWGEDVVAFVVAQPGTTVSGDELDRLCLGHIARFKRPKGYRFVPELPKNNYGKVLKTELRQSLAAEA